MTDKLDLSRPVQVKSGGEARYLGSLESLGAEPHVFAVRHIEGFEFCVQSDDFGRSITRDITLINVPEPKRSGEVWVDVIENPLGHFYTRECLQPEHLGICVPKGHLHVARIGPIKWAEGEGVGK